MTPARVSARNSLPRLDERKLSELLADARNRLVGGIDDVRGVDTGGVEELLGSRRSRSASDREAGEASVDVGFGEDAGDGLADPPSGQWSSTVISLPVSAAAASTVSESIGFTE